MAFTTARKWSPSELKEAEERSPSPSRRERGPDLVIAAMRDRASVNDVAMRTISVIYNQMMDVGCFSDTLDHVGEKMKTAILDEFTKGWISLFSHSPKSRLAWRTQTGLSTPIYLFTHQMVE